MTRVPRHAHEDVAASRHLSIHVDVLAPLRIADDYRVGMAVNRVGGSSFSYSYGVFTGAELVATGESTSVWVEDGRPAPLPEDCRSVLWYRYRRPSAVEFEPDFANTSVLWLLSYTFRKMYTGPTVVAVVATAVSVLLM